MVSRKILIALGVFAVLAIGIASVAAVQNIEVDGIKFAIPDGYGGSVDFNSLKEPSEVEKTIKGHKGWFEFDKESELYFFTYVDNDKIVMITAEDEGLFEKVIV